MTTVTKLTLDDIADLREYERTRDDFRKEVIAAKKKRRVPVGPFMTFVFENELTIRYQIQEMARVEKLITDEAIQGELDAYNPLIPEPGHLSATLLIELTSKDDLMTWLPKLVGIEAAAALRIGAGDEVEEVRCTIDPAHEAQLTRDTVTASVHYVSWSLSPEQVERFGAEPVSLATVHPEYEHETPLSPETMAELRGDLLGS